MRRWRLALLTTCWLSAPGGAPALEPREVFLLVNKNVAESRAVADHYCARRGVPRENQIVLDLPFAGEARCRVQISLAVIAWIHRVCAERARESCEACPCRVRGP